MAPQGPPLPPHTLTDAALTAVLLFTTTSRVISPQYLVWLIGLAAVCLTHRASRMTTPALLVLAASFLTLLEFPIGFVHVVSSDWYGITLLLLRNTLLTTATLLAAHHLWRTTTSPTTTPVQPLPTDRETRVSPEDARAQPSCVLTYCCQRVVKASGVRPRVWCRAVSTAPGRVVWVPTAR